jgi:hypothetical protein
MKLAQDIFGTIAPPPGVAPFADPTTGLTKFIKLAVNFVIIAAGLMLLTYLLWGALDWISSEGDKEKTSKAQGKITNAIIGMILVFAALVIFGYIAGDILGLVKRTPTGWTIFLEKRLSP